MDLQVMAMAIAARIAPAVPASRGSTPCWPIAMATTPAELPIARTYPLGSVQATYREVEKRHTRGKIVLIP